MKDAFGTELQVGDHVHTTPVSSGGVRYAGIWRGVVSRFTPKRVVIEYEDVGSDGEEYVYEVARESRAVAKIPMIETSDEEKEEVCQ